MHTALAEILFEKRGEVERINMGFIPDLLSTHASKKPVADRCGPPWCQT